MFSVLSAYNFIYVVGSSIHMPVSHNVILNICEGYVKGIIESSEQIVLSTQYIFSLLTHNVKNCNRRIEILVAFILAVDFSYYVHSSYHFAKCGIALLIGNIFSAVI